MKLEDISSIFSLLLFVMYLIISGIIIQKHTKEIKYLNNKLDSLTVNNNNYS